MKWGTDTYRWGALERIEEARLLKQDGRYAISMYVAGLAVEGMLRSLKWMGDRGFDERHDLRKIAVHIESLGLLRQGSRDRDFVSSIEHVARHWDNDLRFADFDQLERFLTIKGLIRRKGEDEVKQVCAAHYDRCVEVVGRCNRLWLLHRGKTS